MVKPMPKSSYQVPPTPVEASEEEVVVVPDSPSRKGRTLKPRRTNTVGSSKASILEVGVEVGLSFTSTGVTTPEDCRL